MADRNVTVRFRANIADFQTQVGRMSTSLSEAVRRFDHDGKLAETRLGRIAQSAIHQRAAWDQVGNGMLLAGTAVVAGLTMATKAAIDWESAWTGVAKVVDGADEQLERSLRGLTREVSASHDEIADTAAAAGQLGVAKDDITSYTRAMIDMGVSTDLAANEAATGTARFSAIMGTAHSEARNLGSAIVAMGNNFATTESEVLELAVRLAAAGRTSHMTEGDVIGIAAALKQVGLEAEAGGSSVSRVIDKINQTVRDGGKELHLLADVAGVSATAFAQQWRDKPAEAFAAFVKGLNGVYRAGGDVKEVLRDLGLKDYRIGDSMTRAALAAEHMTGAIKLSNQAFREGTALGDEAARRYETDAAKLQRSWNAVKDAAIDAGAYIAPVVTGVASGVSGIFEAFSGLPSWAQATVVALGGIVGVSALAGGAILKMVPAVLDGSRALMDMGLISERTQQRMLGLGKGLGRAGIAAGLLGIVVAAGEAVQAFDDTIAKADELENRFRAGQGALASGLIGTASATDVAWREKTLEYQANMGAFGKAGSWVVDSLNGLTSLVGWNTRSMGDRFMDEIAALDDQLKNLDFTEARKRFQWFANGTVASEEALTNMVRAMPAFRQALIAQASELGVQATEANLVSLAMGRMTTAQENAEKKARDHELATDALAAALSREEAAAQASVMTVMERAAALGLVAEDEEKAAKALMERAKANREAAESWVVPAEVLSLAREREQAMLRSTAEASGGMTDYWRDLVDNATVSLEGYLAVLDEQLAAQQDWSVNMLQLIGSASTEVVEHIKQLGPQAGAALLAELTDGVDDAEQIAQLEERISTNVSAAYAAALNDPDTIEVLRAASRQLGAEQVEELARALLDGEPVQDVIKKWDLKVELWADRQSASTAAIDWRQHFMEEAQARNGTLKVPVGADTKPAFLDALRFRSVQTKNALALNTALNTRPATRALELFRIDAASHPAAVLMNASTGRLRPQISSALQAPFSISVRPSVSAVPGIGDGRGLAPVAPRGWRAQWAAVKAAVPGAVLTSAYRPGAKTTFGTPSYHGMGRAIDLAPDWRVFNFISRNYPNSRELIFTPAGSRQINNGRRYTETDPTVMAMHRDHIHWAYRDGGAVHGPGTSTSDSIPSWLSDGEHVWTAAEVTATGGHAGVYALRSLARTGELRRMLGLARGGPAMARPPAPSPVVVRSGASPVALQVVVESPLDGAAYEASVAATAERVVIRREQMRRR